MVKIGMMVSDRYEILEKIGMGGMSDVYKAKDHKLNRLVAVKVLKQEFSENATFVSKFHVEAQAAAGLMHPNIVNVYDVGEEDGNHYIVMELVEGITLKKYIEKKARLSVKEAISIAIQVSMGIEAAHNNHIIHRDIKPQNIIISKEGKVKVTDFGIAKAATSNTITSNVMGSVHYTSPEQARGGYSDEKSDVYSLGVTMFEMLTGRVPFNGETTVAIAIKHIQEDMPSPCDYVPEIPRSVEQIVIKCCQKSPDRRYQNMHDLIVDLKHSLMNPDEDFVKIVNPDNEGATKNISDREIASLKRQYDEQDEAIAAANLRRRPERTQNSEARRDPRAEGKGEGRKVPKGKGKAAPQRTSKTAKNPKVRGEKLPPKKNPKANPYPPKREERNLRDNREREEYKRRRHIYDEYEEDDDDEEVSGTEKLTTIVAVVAAVLIGCIVLFLVGRGLGIFGQGKENEITLEETNAEANIRMIDVVGKDAEAVKKALIDAGLTPISEYEENAEFPQGQVVRCSANPGDLLCAGDEVTITISSGLSGIEVPNVVNLSEAEAVSALANAGFTPNKVEGFDDYIKEGNIISQEPAAGTKAPPSASVTIIISKGPEQNKVQVPNLIGQDEETATIILTEYKLTAGTVTEVNTDDPTQAGLVTSQSTPPGSYVEEGTAIDFSVSVGPTVSTYKFMDAIDGPTSGEDANYRSGTTVQVTMFADDGTQLFSLSTSSFPVPAQNITGITSPSGYILFQYVNYTEPTTISNEDGTTTEVEATQESKEIRRPVAFVAE